MKTQWDRQTIWYSSWYILEFNEWWPLSCSCCCYFSSLLSEPSEHVPHTIQQHTGGLWFSFPSLRLPRTCHRCSLAYKHLLSTPWVSDSLSQVLGTQRLGGREGTSAVKAEERYQRGVWGAQTSEPLLYHVLLCDLGRVAWPLCFSVSSAVKWGKKTTYLSRLMCHFILLYQHTDSFAQIMVSVKHSKETEYPLGLAISRASEMWRAILEEAEAQGQGWGVTQRGEKRK